MLFRYYYSCTPLEDGDDWKGGNGYLHDGRNPDYIHWFNTYPLEMGEFLFETTLRHGTYIHALSANDAMYQRADVKVQHGKLICRKSQRGGFRSVSKFVKMRTISEFFEGHEFSGVSKVGRARTEER